MGLALCLGLIIISELLLVFDESIDLAGAVFSLLCFRVSILHPHLCPS